MSRPCSKLIVIFRLTGICFCFGLAAASTASSRTTTNGVVIPPFLHYLTEKDLDAARKVAQERHRRAVEDALTNFPVDDVPCSAAEDEAAVANTPIKELPVRLRSKLPDFHDELPSSIFVSQKPLLTKEECARIIQIADDHFAQHGVNGEWTALPAGQYKMRGFQLKDIPEIRDFLLQVFRRKFLPMVRHTNPKFAESVKDLALDNCYLMKFTPETGARMDIHCDDGCLSFTIQMNPKEEYEGGGTWFEGLAEDENDHAAGIVKMDVGHVHFRAGGIRHCGNTISSGKRYVIGGFAIHRSKVEYSRLLMRGNAEDEMDLTLPAVVALNPEYDEGYAMLAHDLTSRKDRPEAAKEVLEYCLEHVNPRCSKVAFSLGVRHYRREGRYDKVMDCMKIVLAYDPYDVDAMNVMAEAAGELGLVDVEKQMYERIVKVKVVEPEDKSNAYRNLGLLHKGKDVRFEIDCYRNAVAAFDNYQARYSLGRALFEAGELEQARDSFLAAHSHDNSSVGALKALYRTARAIMEKEVDPSLSTEDKENKLVALVGGEKIHNQIQVLMRNSFAK